MKPESFIVTPETSSEALNVLGVNITVLATNVQTQGYEITLQQGCRRNGAAAPPSRLGRVVLRPQRQRRHDRRG